MKQIVLYSGGLDSTVNLYKARAVGEVVLALTFDYGQRAAGGETRVTRVICERLKIPHRIIELPWFGDFTGSSLLNKSLEIPTNVKLDSKEETEISAKKVWVPNRNGVFLNIAASFAEAMNSQAVIAGFNKEEAVTFPDNSPEFLIATTKALAYSTSNGVRAMSYTEHLDKKEIVALGKVLGVNFDLVWACYFGGDAPCGVCESCLRFNAARK